MRNFVWTISALGLWMLPATLAARELPSAKTTQSHAFDAPTSVGGVVDRLAIDPHGRVAGVILLDGTEIPAVTAQAVTLVRDVTPGERVRVVGDPALASDLEIVSTGRSVRLGPAGIVARGGGPSALASAQSSTRI